MSLLQKKPLEGLLVVALEQAVAAPFCSARLADAGARVIKIERMEGDFARQYDASAKGLSSYFVWLNRGKESLVLDIKNHDDLDLLYVILNKSDVFIQNLAPGAAKRAGLDPDLLRRKNKKLITVDITGYGHDNSYMNMKAYDLLIQAETGLANITGNAFGPGRVGVSVCDIACGMNAYSGVLEALLKRSISGQGSHVETSLFASMADWMNVPLIYFEGTGKEPTRIGLAHPSICPYGAFETNDGKLILISIQNEREWEKFCGIFLQSPSLTTAKGFENNNARVANREVVDKRVAERFRSISSKDAASMLLKSETAYGFVNDLTNFSNHPALQRIAVDSSNGPIYMAAPPVTIDGVLGEFGSVPEIGEHSSKIRNEFLTAS